MENRALREIDLWIPHLPPKELGPNRLRASINTRNAVRAKIQDNFSRLLEEIFPPIDRPEEPLASVRFHITFRLPRFQHRDPVNMYGRMKPWEDVLVREGVLVDDNFGVIHSVLLDRIFVFSEKESATQWRIIEVKHEAQT